MDEFLKTASTPNFWLSVVLVGVLINIASHILIPLFGRMTSLLSNTWQRRSLASVARRSELLKRLSENEEARGFFLAEAVEARLSSIQSLLLGCFTLLVSLHLSSQYPEFANPKFSLSMDAMAAKILALQVIGSVLLTFSMQSYMDAQSKFGVVRFIVKNLKSI